MPRLTDITEKNAAPGAGYLVHVVDPTDNTDNEAGSSFRMTVANLVGGFIASLGLYLNKTDDTSDDITQGATNLFLTGAERSKLTGIQAGATANATDAQLRDRSTHTGTQTASTISDFSAAADARLAAGIASHEAETDPHAQYQLREEKGVADGYASLDGSGKVPSAQLPSFVDDVIEAANFATLPGTGETGKIYVTLNDGKVFRWSGTAYVEISASPGSTDAVPEGVGSLYFTVARVRDTVLTGLSTATSAIIAATDSVLVALGKLQAQINTINTTLTGKSDVGHTHDDRYYTEGETDALLAGKANTSHSHAISDVTGLQTALDGKAATSHTHTKDQVGLGNVDNTSDATKNASTATLTNKRITKRVTSETSSATPTINTDNCDIHKITAQTEAITSFTANLSGTPTDGQLLLIQITGTAARAITWGASFEASTVALPTTTVGTARLDVLFIWNAATSKWRCLATA